MPIKKKKKKEEEEIKKPVVQTGTAAPGKTPEFRTTIQGDRFDINLPITATDFSSAQSYEQAKWIKQGGGAGGLSELGEAAVTEEKRRKEEAKEKLETAGAFEEVTPREISLAARPQPGEGVPIIGREIAVTQSLLFNAERKGWLPDISRRDPVTGEEAFPAPTEETLREAALRQISKESFKKGVSLSESFGAFVESIPLIGGAVGKYVGGLVEAPYSNTLHALDEINKVKEAASTGQEKVRNGLEDPDYGLDRARSMEEDVAKLEGRIKILIQTSAILQANTDQVNKIQEQILEAKEKIARYRRASEFGLTASITGTGRIIPTDEQLYWELKGGKK